MDRPARDEASVAGPDPVVAAVDRERLQREHVDAAAMTTVVRDIGAVGFAQPFFENGGRATRKSFWGKQRDIDTRRGIACGSTALPSRSTRATPRQQWSGFVTEISKRDRPNRQEISNPDQAAGMQGSISNVAP